MPFSEALAERIRQRLARHKGVEEMKMFGVREGFSGLIAGSVQRLRARFRVPADLLIPPPKQARRGAKRAAA